MSSASIKEERFYSLATLQLSLHHEKWTLTLFAFHFFQSNRFVSMLKHMNKPVWFLQLFFVRYFSITPLFLHLSTVITWEVTSKTKPHIQYSKFNMWCLFFIYFISDFCICFFSCIAHISCTFDRKWAIIFFRRDACWAILFVLDNSPFFWKKGSLDA